MTDKRCSFRASAYFKDVPDGLIKCTSIAYPWDARKFTPKFTGIPPHMTLMYDMEVLRRKFYALRSDIKIDMHEMMDERRVDG